MDKLFEIQRLFNSPDITVEQYLEGLCDLRKINVPRIYFERINYVSLLKKPYKTLRGKEWGISKDQKEVAMANAKLVANHVKSLPARTYKDVFVDPKDSATSDIVRINIRRALSQLLLEKAKSLDEEIVRKREKEEGRRARRNERERAERIKNGQNEKGENESDRADDMRMYMDDYDETADMLDPTKLATAIEAEIYKTFRGVNEDYKEFYRTLDTALMNEGNLPLVELVLYGQTSPAALSKFSIEDFESPVQCEERKKNIELYKALANRQALADKMAIVTDEYTCSKCGNKRCTSYQKQIRSSDEPMTICITCLTCRHSWKIN